MTNTWFITVASSGIGKGSAKVALAQGDRAVVTARDTKRLAELAGAYPDTCLPVSLELSDPASIRAAVQAAQEQFGTVDILVNNAGHGYRAAIEEGEDAAVTALYADNLFGAITLTKLLLPAMRAQRRGAVVNVSSIAAVQSGVGSGYYASTKAALELVSDALYQEVSPLGIKVMVVEPGSFRTRFYDEALQGTGIKIEDYAATAGRTRKENIRNLHDQPGDPDAAGRIIVETIGKDDYPRTLLLGSDAVNLVRGVLQRKMTELEKWEAVSRGTDYKA